VDKGKGDGDRGKILVDNFQNKENPPLGGGQGRGDHAFLGGKKLLLSIEYK